MSMLLRDTQKEIQLNTPLIPPLVSMVIQYHEVTPAYLWYHQWVSSGHPLTELQKLGFNIRPHIEAFLEDKHWDLVLHIYECVKTSGLSDLDHILYDPRYLYYMTLIQQNETIFDYLEAHPETYNIDSEGFLKGVVYRDFLATAAEYVPFKWFLKIYHRSAPIWYKYEQIMKAALKAFNTEIIEFLLTDHPLEEGELIWSLESKNLDSYYYLAKKIDAQPEIAAKIDVDNVLRVVFHTYPEWSREALETFPFAYRALYHLINRPELFDYALTLFTGDFDDLFLGNLNDFWHQIQVFRLLERYPERVSSKVLQRLRNHQWGQMLTPENRELLDLVIVTQEINEECN